MNSRTRKLVFVHVLLVPSLLLFIFPTLWLMLMSVRTLPVMFGGLEAIFSTEFTLDSYRALFANYDVARFVFNSVIASLVPTIFCVTFGTLAAYAIVRFQRASGLTVLPLAAQLIPDVQMIIPIYALMLLLGLLNTYAAIFLSYTALVLPLAVWMLTTYLRAVPIEIEEAALVDGCTRLQAIAYVIVPVILPGMTAVALVSFLSAWGDFLYAFTLLNGDEMRLIGVAVYMFMPGANTPMAWGMLFAISTVYVVPVLVLFLGLHRYISKGLTAGAVQG
jgi:multiple sugar transport system permease protein